MTVLVQVWLAALREPDKQDWTEQRLICEDHFLPEDVSTAGVRSGAIPIMPPYLDGPLVPSGSWSAQSSEEEEEEDPDPPQQVRPELLQQSSGHHSSRLCFPCFQPRRGALENPESKSRYRLFLFPV